MLMGAEGFADVAGGALVVKDGSLGGGWGGSVTGGPVAISVPGGGFDDVGAEGSGASSAL